jgi:type VI secretion system protein ImpF
MSGASLLDRLIDDEPGSAREAVRRDVQNLLNARGPWRPLSAAHSALRGTIRGYGLPDFTSGAFNAPEQREALRADILAVITAFEPRLTRVRVSLLAWSGQGAPALRLMIEANLADGSELQRVIFQTLVDGATTDMQLSAIDE